MHDYSQQQNINVKSTLFQPFAAVYLQFGPGKQSKNQHDMLMGYYTVCWDNLIILV